MKNFYQLKRKKCEKDKKKSVPIIIVNENFQNYFKSHTIA